MIKEVPMADREQERLKRLRNRQLTERDPLVKQRKFQHSSSIKEKRARKPFSLLKAWADIPHVIKFPFYGLLLGVITVIVLPYFWNSKWTLLASVGVTVVLMIFGIVIGNAFDLRDDIQDNLK